MSALETIADNFIRDAETGGYRRVQCNFGYGSLYHVPVGALEMARAEAVAEAGFRDPTEVVSDLPLEKQQPWLEKGLHDESYWLSRQALLTVLRDDFDQDYPNRLRED